MAKSPEVGRPAPDFTLPSLQLVDGEVVRADRTLSEERGHPVVLAFYPGDDTAVCTKQLCSYSSGLEARKHDLRMPLLSDTQRTAVAAYGIGLGSLVRRAVFIVDAQGVLHWKHVAALGLTFRDVDTLTHQLAALKIG
jgi:peroxiredoxin Q/BCP